MYYILYIIKRKKMIIDIAKSLNKDSGPMRIIKRNLFIKIFSIQSNKNFFLKFIRRRKKNDKEITSIFDDSSSHKMLFVFFVVPCNGVNLDTFRL